MRRKISVHKNKNLSAVGKWPTSWDIVSTQLLVSRVTALNAEVAPYVQAFDVLRPIPQREIDLVTEGPIFPQNPGYSLSS